jgi:hypothetical protein
VEKIFADFSNEEAGKKRESPGVTIFSLNQAIPVEFLFQFTVIPH